MPDDDKNPSSPSLDHGEYSLSGGHGDWTHSLPNGFLLTNLRLSWGSTAPGYGLHIGLADVIGCSAEHDIVDLSMGEDDIHVRLGVPSEHADAVACGLGALAANARHQQDVHPGLLVPDDHDDAI
jgi:hypothetical protein